MLGQTNNHVKLFFIEPEEEKSQRDILNMIRLSNL